MRARWGRRWSSPAISWSRTIACTCGPRLDGEGPALEGPGATHAWVQVYLPGAGWLEFDPTSGLIGGTNLIRVGVARDPRQAVPLQGSYSGDASDFLDMTVEVTVTKARADA